MNRQSRKRTHSITVSSVQSRTRHYITCTPIPRENHPSSKINKTYKVRWITHRQYNMPPRCSHTHTSHWAKRNQQTVHRLQHGTQYNAWPPPLTKQLLCVRSSIGQNFTKVHGLILQYCPIIVHCHHLSSYAKIKQESEQGCQFGRYDLWFF